MSRMISVGASVVAATLLVAATAFPQGATANKRTILTFSGTVQVPGATLPAGTYVFRIADPASQKLWQVFDATERHLLAQFFYVRTPDRSIEETNEANGKPVVRFYETPQGMTPAIRVFYYPTDLAGAEFLYPKAKAKELADAELQLRHGTEPAQIAIANPTTTVPDLTQGQDIPTETAPLIAEQAPSQPAIQESQPVETSASTAQQAVGTSGRDEEPRAVGTSGKSAEQPIRKTSPQKKSRAVGTSGKTAEKPVGTSGSSETQAAPQANAEASKSAELPKTASVVPLVTGIGLLALSLGIAARARRLRHL